jgi:phenylacetate-CoA ligase
MFGTGIRQFRMALSMVWGRPFNTDSLVQLVQDAVSTVAEFGELGAEARELLETPFTDADDRADYASRALRRTARRLARKSPYYAEHFAASGLRAGAVDVESLRALPVTTKRDLVQQPDAFLCRGSRPHLATRTTGTTGRAVEIWLSAYELEMFAGLSALSSVLHDELHAGDIMQVHVSSRATAAVQLTAATCRMVGARCRLLGMIPPDDALDSLLDGATRMSANPSYLAELVLAARRRGLAATDFRLRRVDAAGEILSASLRAAAETIFGARVHDNFGMTEAIPVSATSCSAGHLHHDLTMGHVEVLDLHTGLPAQPGELGTLVITPYFPYRECMPVFRYDTRDVVRLPDSTGTPCEQAGLPGTSKVLGKADQLVRSPAGTLITPRELVDAVEALPTQPWPARFRAEAVGNDLRLLLPRSAVAGLTAAELFAHFSDRGLQVLVEPVNDSDAQSLRPVRSDLRELTFSAPIPIGA